MRVGRSSSDGSAADRGAHGQDIVLPEQGFHDANLNGGDGKPPPPSNLACKDPKDEVNSNLVCQRRDHVCNVMLPCEDDYRCNEQTQRCECIDARQCGIACSGGNSCPPEWICHPTEAVCVTPAPCFSDEQCPAGQLCLTESCPNEPCLPEPLFGRHYCTVPGQQGVGQSCTADRDCAEGVCETKICLHACKANADCEANLYCARTDRGRRGCMVVQSCDPPCTGGDEYCEGGATCPQSCAVSADCPGGQCESYIDGTYRCGTSSGNCDAAEVVLWGPPIGLFCMIHQLCWFDVDCPQPYECVDLGEIDRARYTSGLLICSRSAT